GKPDLTRCYKAEQNALFAAPVAGGTTGAISRDGRLAALVRGGEWHIHLIDLENERRLGAVAWDVGEPPREVAVSPDGEHLAVVCGGLGKIIPWRRLLSG